MRRLGIGGVLVLLLIGGAACGTSGWSAEYRAEQTSRCANFTASAAGYTVTSWCKCMVDYREGERSESEDRSITGGGEVGPISRDLVAACASKAPPALTARIGQLGRTYGWE
jgi:hypothetical protein